CRTGHAFIGEYYADFVPTEQIACPCGEPFQSRDHILATCPLYNPHRHYLATAIPTLFLPEILGTDEGIEALIRFIEKSGAFTKTGEPRAARVPPALVDEDAADDDEDDEEEGEEDEDEVDGDE
ncbi:hypothetical protein PLICRDRAFT_70422, partial [Plicaturopsis crispa FD-325 SS-3]